MAAMSAVNDNLAMVNEKMKKDDADVKEVASLLAAAGKSSKAVDIEVMEHIECKAEFEFINETLTEFSVMEEAGMLSTEESASICIAEHKALAEKCEKAAAAIKEAHKP